MKYHTILINGYSVQAGTDQRATGGVHLLQAAKSVNGWRTRVVDSNGRYESAGRSESATAAQVDALIVRAVDRTKNNEENGRASDGAASREEAHLRMILGIQACAA